MYNCITNGNTDRGDPNDPKVRLRRDCVGIMAGFRVLPALEDRVFLLANTQIYWYSNHIYFYIARIEHPLMEYIRSLSSSPAEIAHYWM